MAKPPPPRIAVLGAGPIGLEAALYAQALGFAVSVFEDITEAQRRVAAGAGLSIAALRPDQRERFAAVFILDGASGPRVASPAEIAAGAFRLRETQILVRLSAPGSRQWEPLEEEESAAGAEADPLRATVTRVQLSFHVGTQEAPRVTFRHEGTPEPAGH